jgi:hypothetical protein
LDALERGETVPIESNVPPEVGPIRRVKIVVGREDVPRRSLGAVNHTAYFAGQGTGAPAGSSAYDRYANQPIGPVSGVSPPPSVLERAQTAVTETGTTLRDGIEAGIQAANEQLSQTSDEVLDSTRNASQQFGQQLQDLASNPAQQIETASNNLRSSAEQAFDAVGNQFQQVTNPFTNVQTQPAASMPTQSGVSPPPGYTPAVAQGVHDAGQVGGTAAVRTPTGWTSIGSNVAAPPLIVPQMATAANRDAANSTRVASSDGPGFPPASQQGSDAARSWANNGGMVNGNAPPTIGGVGAPAIRRDGSDSSLATEQPFRTSAPDSQRSASQPIDPWNGIDPWAQQRQANAGGLGSQNTAGTMGHNMQSQTGNLASQSNVGSNGNGSTRPPADTGVTSHAEQQPPWIPFVIVCLTLVGSLSANLFLGWSYLDARQRYRSLVRKTAETFRRVATSAA